MKKEWWQIVETTVQCAVFLYIEDEHSSEVLRYSGCLYDLVGKSREEVLLRSAILGNAVVFKTKPNVTQSVVLKKHIEVLDI